MNFGELLPELIYQTVRDQGFLPTGALFPLNSYENRVYEIGLEGNDPIIGKYYRPGRWSAEAIAEEHGFLKALVETEIPVVAPLVLPQAMELCESLAETEGLYYAFFPKFRGREHAEITQDDLKWLGRTLSRMHNVGEHFNAAHRLPLNSETYGEKSLEDIHSQNIVPPDLRPNLEVFLRQALDLIRPFFSNSLPVIALHGDCHPGNILWNAEGPHFLDFDDMVLASPVQDIWMLFNGSPEEQREQRDIFFEGYEVFREFDYSTLRLAEPLRTLRMIRHTAWIGHRIEEPIFQKAFPYFREHRYWEQFLLSIKEQIALLQE